MAGEASAVNSPTEFNVHLLKSQQDQQAKIVNKLVKSIEPSAPNVSHVTGKGQVVDLKA